MSYLHKIWHNADYPCIDPALLRRRSHLHRTWSRKEISNREDAWWVKKWVPHGTHCPSTIFSLTIKWHLTQLRSKCVSWRFLITLLNSQGNLCQGLRNHPWNPSWCSRFGQRKSPSYTPEVKQVRSKDQRHSPVGEYAVGIGEGSLT